MAHENRILMDTGDGHWGRKQSTACNPTEMKLSIFHFSAVLLIAALSSEAKE